MPLSYTTASSDQAWSETAWLVDDKQELARLVALVALGHARHVTRILRETGCEALIPPATQYQGARKLLEVPEGKAPYHRDGWLFQVIAWIAAWQQRPTALVRPPQMRWADKGFDNLYILVEAAPVSLSRVVICEEKATTDPRRRIRKEVWPAIEEIETGLRDNELLDTISSLLAGHSHRDELIANILWDRVRAYRVSVTIESREDSPASSSSLFGGFDNIVRGEPARRWAAVLRLDDVRIWLADLANRAMNCLEDMEADDV